MLKTAIVSPPEPNWVINPMPILGPAILKTFLESKGYKIDLVNLSVKIRYLNRFPLRKIFNLKLFDNRDRIVNFLENSNDNLIKTEVKKMIKLGHLKNYDVVGFNFITANIKCALCIAKVLKENYDKKIVFGSAVTKHADYTDLLDLDFIDFLIVGDGEEPFLKILRHLEGKDSIVNCDGIFYKKDGQVHTSKPNSFPIENKSLPSFNIEELKLYKKLSTNGLSILPYLLSRGCRFKCAFCYEYKNTFFNYMPLEKVISDIRFLLKTYKVNFIFFGEGNINNNSDYIRKLSELIITEKLKFSWGGFATIVGLDKDTIKLMAKSGCKNLLVGVESGSETISIKMNLLKKKRIEEFKRTLKLLHKYGIRTHNFYIVEFPYETFEDFKKTLNLIKETSNYTTTANAGAFLLADNSLMGLNPQAFNVKMREPRKYRFLYIGQEFDEINGLKWEEKLKRGLFKEKIANGIIYKQVATNLILRSLLKNPLFAMKRKISHPYATFDEYLM